MKRLKKATTAMLIAGMLLSSTQGLIINAAENNATQNVEQKEESIITIIDAEKIQKEIKEPNIFYKEAKIAPEKPYVTRISKSQISIGSYYSANISLYGQARKGSKVYIKLGSQVIFQDVDDSQSFGFNLETRSRNITVELYTVNNKGEQSDSTYVNLTADGDTISNNGTYPTPNTVPTINANDKAIILGSKFDPLKDVSASDNEDGDLTNKLIITENTVDTSKIGDYKVIYQVTDSDDNIAIKECKIKVDVNKEPEISASDVEINVGEKFDAKKLATAKDYEDGDITDKIEIIENTVDTSKVGVYKVVYKVTDSEGASEKKEIKVTVVQPLLEINRVPEISASDVEINVGEKFDAKKLATAKDHEDGDITDKIEIIENTVDTSKVGVYKVVYKVTDSQGATTTKTITVTVIVELKFKDVKGHWAEDTVELFVKKGYINGYGDNTFRPNNSMTRAEFVKIVNKVFGYTQKGTEQFTDVKEGDWFYTDICIGIRAGYIQGKSKDTFAPNDNITRQEVAMILTNIMNNKDENLDKLNAFKDGNQTSKWAQSSIEGAIEAGYLNGYEDNTIRANGNITRAEAVTMLSRVKNK